MNRVVKIGLLAAAVAMLASCSEYESKGNSAYDRAKTAQGSQKRLAQKEAYIYFQKAVQADPAKITIQLRNRFLEMSLVRAEMVLNDGTATNDALTLYQKQDIDPLLNGDVKPETHDRYATFLTSLADSMFAMGRLTDGFQLITKAADVCADKAKFGHVRDSIVGNKAQEFVDKAKNEIGPDLAKNSDPVALIRAEFFVQAAMLYNKDLAGAKDLLTQLRIKNLGTLSAYRSVFVDDLPDTTVFRAVNKYYFFMAVTKKNGDIPTDVLCFNYSPNAQRMLPQCFFLVDENGKEYPATACKAPPSFDMLDQQKKTTVQLKFPPISGKIQKLYFKGLDGSMGEKWFY